MRTFRSQNTLALLSAYDQVGRREIKIHRIPTSATRRRVTFRSYLRSKLAVNFASDALFEFKPVIRTKSRMSVIR